MMDEPNWDELRERLMGLTMAQLRPLRSGVFNGNLGGASGKAAVVGEVVTQMRYWWRNHPRMAHEALDAVTEALVEAES